MNRAARMKSVACVVVASGRFHQPHVSARDLLCGRARLVGAHHIKKELRTTSIAAHMLELIKFLPAKHALNVGCAWHCPNARLSRLVTKIGVLYTVGVRRICLEETMTSIAMTTRVVRKGSDHQKPALNAASAAASGLADHSLLSPQAALMLRATNVLQLEAISHAQGMGTATATAACANLTMKAACVKTPNAQTPAMATACVKQALDFANARSGGLVRIAEFLYRTAVLATAHTPTAYVIQTPEYAAVKRDMTASTAAC